MKKRFLFLFLISGLVLMNGCQREYSLENGNTPSEGLLQDDGAGDCLPKTVAGAYVVNVALVGTTNYIDVQVNVTTVGSYTIYTDTVNGMYFRGSGVFTTTGLNTVRLKGNGTPLSVGISNFIVTYGLSGCTIAVTTVGSLSAFTLDGAPGGCMGAAVAGTYTVGTLLNATNNVTINVTVTTVGAYNISTTLSNGMAFSGSGVFASTGTQAIVLTGSGTPTSSGNTNIPVTAGSSSCSFTVSVGAAAGAATFTVNCGTAVPNGTYTAGTALTASNTVTITVNVTVIGSYTITTTTTNGMTFTASGTFAVTGAPTITLAGSGTPTVSGATTIPVTAGTTPCNFTVTVVAGSGAATFAVNCGTATINGAYLINTALIPATNTVTISVNVTTTGSYTITTTATNGMTFSASGTFAATGVQNVTLNGTGTPTAAGTFTIPVPSGTAPCSFSLTVYMGTWSFTEGANNFSGFINDAAWDLTTFPPYLILYFSGPTAAGHYFEIDLVDVSTTIANGETYNAAVFTGAANSGLLYFEGPPPASPILYQADPSNIPNTLIFTVTSHNAGTKTVIGTFAGNVLDGSPVPVTKIITNGIFRVTYP